VKGVVTYLMPIESTNRELDYKLVLASLLKAPHRQFLFFRPDLAQTMVGLTHAGIWVGQNIRVRTPDGDDYGRYERMKRAGFSVVYVDEEGAIFPGAEDTWASILRQRVDPLRLAEDDVLVGWGSFQRGVWSADGKTVARVLESGHPRFDLCRSPYVGIYEDERARIERKHGRFILINTNFAAANYVGGLAGLFNRRDGYLPDDTQKRLAFVDGWQRALTSVGVFVSTAHALAARFPEVKFILRPHPVENHELYERVLAGVPNLCVEHEGSAVPWLRAATAVIHNGCTTAIEAHLAGVRPIAFCPPSIGDGESWVPNLFSARTVSLDELVNVVDEVLGGREPRMQAEGRDHQRARSLMTQLQTARPERDSFQTLVDTISQVEGAVRARGPSFHERAARVAAEAHGAAARAKAVARRAREVAGRSLAAPPKFQLFDRTSFEERCRRVSAVGGGTLSARVLSSTACLVS
jgi:surface carbohydrate biosynthesis protein